MNPKKTKVLVATKPSEQSVEQTPAMATGEALIAQAIDKNVPVETMEKLLAMRRELRQEHAREEFNKALSLFQSKCPTIKKTKKVFEKNSTVVRYSYAPLESIVEQVKKYLAECGLSYSIDVEQDEKFMGVICKVTHIAGYRQESTFKVPIGSEGYMTDVQKYGARLTFAKRYVFCNALGILTGDEDTDAVEPAATKPQGHQEPRSVAKPIDQPMMTEFQKKKIAALLEKKGKTQAAAIKFCRTGFNKAYPSITIAEANIFIGKLEQLPDQQNIEHVDPDEVIAGIEAEKKDGDKI